MQDLKHDTNGPILRADSKAKQPPLYVPGDGEPGHGRTPGEFSTGIGSS